MRRYELMVILSDLLDEDGVESLLQRVRDLVTERGGRVVDEAYWGKRQFAYEIAKRHYGYYAVFDIESSVEDRLELERQLGLSDDVVRFKTVRPELRVKTVG